MSAVDEATNDLKVARIVIFKLGETFNQLQSHSLSILTLSDQWQNLQNAFGKVQNLLENRVREFEAKNREIDATNNGLENMKKEVELKKKELELEEKSLRERSKRVEIREKQLKDWYESLILEKKEIEERFLERFERVRAVEEACCEREKVLKENVDKMELRAKQLKELESRKKELNERIQKRCLEVERREKAVEENCRAVEVREEKIDQRIRELEAKEEGIDKRCRLIELEEKRIEERCESVGLKEREAEERYAMQELRDKQLSERCEGLASKEKGLIEKMEEMKVKEREVEERCKAVELREREIDELCKEQELRDKQLNKKCKGLELKERHIDERLREVDSKLKETDEACEKLELKRKQMLEYTEKNNSNDKQLRDKCGGLGNEGKCVNERDKGGIEMNDGFQISTLKQCVMKDGVTLQMYLNDRVDEHGFMDEEVSSALELSHMPHKLVLDALIGFYPPHLSKGNFMYEASAARSSCVLLLKQLINMKRSIGKKLKKKAKGLALFWKDRMLVEGEDQIVVLSFLLLVVAYDLRSYFEKDELQRLYEILNKDRITLELGRELNLLSASEELQVIDADASSAMNHRNKVHSLCLSMDANGLRSYIGQHLMEQSVYLEKVRDALQCAPDPAKLLLDVVQIFNQPESTAVEKTSCIYLLELLMKLQKQQPSINLFGQTEDLVRPPLKITNNLRHKANELACTWKQTLADKGCKLLEAYGFLQFVATYRLERSFKEDELLQLFKRCYSGDLVYRPEQNPRLCHALGLTKRIPGLIDTLVKGDRKLLAVKYICTFMMESRFPLVPLLKDHLKVIEKKPVKLQKGRNYHAAKIDAAHFKIRNLKAVLQYINDYRLESKFSPVPLESRIEELERQIAEVKTATTGEAQGAIVRKEGVKGNISIVLEMDVEDGSNELEKKEENISLLQASLADRSEQSGGNKRTSNPCNSLELPQVKRPRAGDPESPVSPNVSKACPMNTHSGSTQLSGQPMRQLGSCTSGHQSHVRPSGLPVLPPETLPAVSRSSVQYSYPLSSNVITPYGGTGQFGPTVASCPGGSNVELKTASSEVKQVAATECTVVEKDKSKESASHLVNEPEKKLPPTPYAQTASEFGGNKQSSSPCTSLVSPRLEKQLRPEALQSQFPSNIPIARPVTTHSMPVNPPQPSPQPWRQPVPYPFEHQAYVGSNGFPMWHPGPWPAVNGSNAHIGFPGGNYGTPYGGTGQVNPAGTWTGQVNPAGVFHYGNPPRPGYFAGG